MSFVYVISLPLKIKLLPKTDDVPNTKFLHSFSYIVYGLSSEPKGLDLDTDCAHTFITGIPTLFRIK